MTHRIQPIIRYIDMNELDAITPALLGLAANSLQYLFASRVDVTRSLRQDVQINVFKSIDRYTRYPARIAHNSVCCDVM